ncbi:hypothetical protein FRY98_26320 [Paenibacillus faecis]|uniref:Uncharacterized protein n=1 Tax=Paenibacillus faecis TaxID=862114 RepID=A0A5D0CJU0_9BACL|nr:hypothetical protein [Paenibacillus faecis]TYA10111.1 hypothetical protein FRY98_26320 [Paenibacillus faecis]
MRKALHVILTIGLMLVLGQSIWGPDMADAATEGGQRIKDIAYDNAILMDDGSMWTLMIDGKGKVLTPGNVASISETSRYAGLGVTRDGKLIEWDMGLSPRAVEGQTGLKQVAGYYWLKEDGTVWTSKGKMKGLENIEHIGYGDRFFAALSSSGELYFQDSYQAYVFHKVGTVPDPSAVTAIAVYDGRAALLYNNGKVVLYHTFDFDDNGKPIPFIGSANMTVVSTETAALVKKAMQGSLANYVGKSYWVNYFQGWDRIMKVTVTDILPDDTGSFVIVFKTATGKTLKSYSMTSGHVAELLSNRTAFFNFDPYKKYQWSSSVWNQIKAGHIALGMTKEQVLLSWGEPAGKSATQADGKTIETWVYANFDTVAFVNGKVKVIIN